MLFCKLTSPVTVNVCQVRNLYISETTIPITPNAPKLLLTTRFLKGNHTPKTNKMTDTIPIGLSRFIKPVISCTYAITFTVSSDKNSSSLPGNGMHALQIIPFPLHKKAPTCSLSNTQGLSCHILSSVILAHRVLDNLFFCLLFRCNFCCFCMFFAITNDHKCHAEYY